MLFGWSSYYPYLRFQPSNLNKLKMIVFNVKLLNKSRKNMQEEMTYKGLEFVARSNTVHDSMPVNNKDNKINSKLTRCVIELEECRNLKFRRNAFRNCRLTKELG